MNPNTEKLRKKYIDNPPEDAVFFTGNDSIKFFINLPVACINAAIADHFEMLFRDMADQFLWVVTAIMVSGAIPDTSTIPISAMLSALPCSMKWTPKSALLSKGLSHAVTGQPYMAPPKEGSPQLIIFSTFSMTESRGCRI